MNWKETEILVGTVNENSTIRVIFEGTEEQPEIIDINAGCRSCTSYKFDKEKKLLHVSIEVGELPQHFKIAGKDQIFRKIIKVRYANGKEQVLTVVGNKRFTR